MMQIYARKIQERTFWKAEVKYHQRRRKRRRGGLDQGVIIKSEIGRMSKNDIFWTY